MDSPDEQGEDFGFLYHFAYLVAALHTAPHLIFSARQSFDLGAEGREGRGRGRRGGSPSVPNVERHPRIDGA